MPDWDLVAQVNAVRNRVDRLTAPQSDTERDAIATAQTRADSVAAMFGQRASGPVTGESPLAYRKRLLAHYQRHSAPFANVRLDSLDASALGPIEDIVYADAAAAARRPETHGPGVLVPVTTTEFGRDVTRFVGDIGSWMGLFAQPGATIAINRNPPARPQ